MNRKMLKRIKLLSFICIVILIIESIYVLYSLFFKSTETLYFDSINSIDNNSLYYVTVGSNNNNDNHYEKAKVSMYNKKHEKVFEKLYNFGYNSAFFGVEIDGEDIITVGSYEKNKIDHKDSLRRSLIVKYDSTGEMIFEKEFRVLDNSKFISINVVDDGYIVTGQSVYKNTKIGNKDGGAILVKYDKNGKLLWSKTFGSNKTSIFNDLLVKDNYIYTVGVLDNNIGVICKYDLDGNLINTGEYKYTDSIGFNSIVSIDNNIYVSGSDSDNALLVEYDLDCNYINKVLYETEGNSNYNKMVVDKDNNIVVIGTIANKKESSSKTANDFNYDGIIGKYKSSLEKISVVEYGDERDDYFTDIKYIDNNYLVAGYSSYEDGSYMSKFIRYSDALKVLEVD